MKIQTRKSRILGTIFLVLLAGLTLFPTGVSASTDRLELYDRDAAFLIKEELGYVVVMDYLSQNEKVKDTGIRLDSLPEADRRAIISGLVIHGRPSLTQILEAFGA